MQRDLVPSAGITPCVVQAVPMRERTLHALQGAGFSEVVSTGRSGSQQRFAAAQRGGVCPCCTKQHDSNDWFVREEGARFVVRNYSQECRAISIDAAGRRIIAATGGGGGEFLRQLPQLGEDGWWAVDEADMQRLAAGASEFAARVVG